MWVMRPAWILSLALAGAACGPTTVSEADPPPGTKAAVVEVSDGDSLAVAVEGIEQRVRLIGVNAPEHDECFGGEARRALEALVGGRTVVLVGDVEREDQYGRWLRYVYIDGVLVNEALTADGYVFARSYPPNTAEQGRIDGSEAQARSEGKGLWAAGACTVESAITITALEADAPGPDGENLNGEWVELHNDGLQPVDLGGWTVRDGESVNRYLFPPGSTLSAGEHLRLYSGCGDDSRRDYYWCSELPVWNNEGDVAFLLDASGRIADRLRY
jgi:micrococcal nuclease